MRLPANLTRNLLVLSAVAAAALAGATPAPAAAQSPAARAGVDDQSFASSIFMATHNSYTGGTRGSIVQQLNWGSRFVEFDIRNRHYGDFNDFQIGHSWNGNEVDHDGGNPASNSLRDWLNVINTWSKAHPGHAPITVMVDLKSDLTSANREADGNLFALNRELKAAFGSRLVLAQDVAKLGTIGALRNKILTLISGSPDSRVLYKRDTGISPAIAVNPAGQVVEVHDSGGGNLFYWSGQLQANGTITWLAHGRYDSGTEPAVVLNDSGFLVEVHKSGSRSRLFSHVGKIGTNGEVSWGASQPYDDGVTPTLKLTGELTVREIHKSQSHDQNWYWRGTINPFSKTVTWQGHGKTVSALYTKNQSNRGPDGSYVKVSTAPVGPYPATTLKYYTTAAPTGHLIAYPQVAFVETQPGDNDQFRYRAIFYAGPASDKTFLVAARNAGHVARAWDFDDAGEATTPLSNFPATNTPQASWYTTMLTNHHYVTY